jgi:hypothetical protein
MRYHDRFSNDNRRQPSAIVRLAQLENLDEHVIYLTNEESIQDLRHYFSALECVSHLHLSGGGSSASGTACAAMGKHAARRSYVCRSHHINYL